MPSNTCQVITFSALGNPFCQIYNLQTTAVYPEHKLISSDIIETYAMKVLRKGGGGGEEGQSSGQDPHLLGWLGGLGRRQVLQVQLFNSHVLQVLIFNSQVLQVQLFNSQVLHVQLLHITYLYRIYYWVSTNAQCFVDFETSKIIAKNP
jgi:hypothetical protein